MMNKGAFFLSGVLIGIVLLVSVCAVVDKQLPEQQYRNLFFDNTKVMAPAVPAEAGFAGEPAPLDMIYVREALDREIMAATFMHSSTIMMFKRANRYFPVIEPILKKNGIPDDFKYLAVAESNLANVTSPAGAEGYWQIMKATGIKYGLEINEFVDERYHIEKATEAACRYLQEARQTFKSWTVTAASYNRGMGGMDKALKNQQQSDFYDLWLNEETARYIYRILALKEVYLNPVRYGFYLLESEFYPPLPARTISVDSAIRDLPSFAGKFGISYKVLRELNPWIQDYSLPNKTGKRYQFLIPEKKELRTENFMKKIQPGETFFHDTLTMKSIH